VQRLLLIALSCDAFNVKCKFKEDIVWQHYGCDVQEWPNNANHNHARISAIEGQHLPQRSNEDVYTLRMEGMRGIKYFTNDVFAKFRNLRYLIVHSTSLRYLLRGDFTLASNLMTLHITHNGVTSLEDYCFHGAESLKTLTLRNNKIRDVSEHAFKGLSTLKFLTISHNEIDSLHATTFDDQIYMEQLSLSSNRLRHIDERLFSRNFNLEVLFLDNNHLTVVSGKLFESNLRLRELYMDNNQINRVLKAQQFLVNLKDLQIAVFSNNTCTNAMLLIMSGFHPIYGEVFKNCTAQVH
jgi:Leucine-rich repeat (LRR) protein